MNESKLLLGLVVFFQCSFFLFPCFIVLLLFDVSLFYFVIPFFIAPCFVVPLF
jgi:hypothetical protein